MTTITNAATGAHALALNLISVGWWSVALALVVATVLLEQHRARRARHAATNAGAGWSTCMVCDSTRPIRLVTIAHRPIRDLEWMYPDARVNVRYCTDRYLCRSLATRPGAWAR